MAAMSTQFVSYFDYTHYDPVLPELRDGVDIEPHTVAIVGGGPIGLALALGLARHGVRSVVLEADDSVCTGSRAGAASRRSIEIFEQLGMAKPIMRQGLPWSEGWSYHRTREVFHLDVPRDAGAKYPPFVNIQQCYVEQYMVEALERQRELVEIRWRNRVSGVRSEADGVELDISTPRGDYRLRADWVVACDGAQSSLRRALGLRFAGTQYEARYVIVDIKLRSDLKEGRRAWFDPPSNPGATLLLHKHKNDLWRFDYQLRPDEDAEEAVRPENVLARVQSHLELMGERGAWDPVWISLYKASALTLERYRHDRVLLAGDAAHLVPIFGVRGLNSGVDDTHNLAWKLAFVAKGLADDRLLDTYSDERVFATRENLRHSSKSAEFMDPPSPAFALMRRAVLGLAETHEWVRSLINPRQSTAVGFPRSPLNVSGDDEEFMGGPRPGENLPDAPVVLGEGESSHLSSLLGPRFTLLVFTPDAAYLEQAWPIAEERHDVPFAAIAIVRTRFAHCLLEQALDATGTATERFDAMNGAVYLARPDGHLLARWREPNAQVIDAAIAHCLNGGTI